MTGLIIKITGVDNAKEIEFYVERERSINIKKEELIKKFLDYGVEYYAYIDTDKVGRGNLMARVVFEDKEDTFTREVVVSGYTGFSIPCMGEGNTISCGDYEVTFSKEKDIPKNTGTRIFYGTINEKVSYREITADMVLSLPSRDVEAFAEDIEVKRGKRIVIAIPYDSELKAYKDNGFGGAVKFSTSIMGVNGMELNIDEIGYKIYGELSTVNGKLKIHIK